MKILAIVVPAVCIALSMSNAANAATVSYVDGQTSYFGTSKVQAVSPYGRKGNQDWSWRQLSYTGAFTSAVLNIAAFDVDVGEVDNIYAFDSTGSTGSWIFLGSLYQAGNLAFSYSTFNLGSNFYDDIVSGLRVIIDIDATQAGWHSDLVDSWLDLSTPMSRTVPEPGSFALLGLGLAGLVVARKRKV